MMSSVAEGSANCVRSGATRGTTGWWSNATIAAG